MLGSISTCFLYDESYQMRKETGFTSFLKLNKVSNETNV